MPELTEDLAVRITTETRQFSAGLREATGEIRTMTTNAAQGIAQINASHNTLLSTLAGGGVKRELRQIAGELGGMAGAGGLASREMNALLGAVRAVQTGIGTLAGGIGLAVAAAGGLIAAFTFLRDRSKEAADEAEKQEIAIVALARAYREAEEAQANLNAAQRAGARAAKEVEAARYAELVKQDEIALAALQKQIDMTDRSIRDLSRDKSENGTIITILLERLRDLRIQYDLTNAELDAHRRGLEDATAAAKEATKATRELNEVIVPPDLIIAGRLWREQQAQIKKTREETDKLAATLGQAADKGAEEFTQKWNEAMGNFMRLTSGMQAAMRDFLTDSITGTQTLAEAWKAFADSFIQETIRMMATAAVRALFNMLGLGILGSGARALATGEGGPFAAIASGLGLQLAEGGIVTQPTLAVVGEAGPEAVIPLDQTGALGGGSVVISGNRFELNFPNVRHGADIGGPRFSESLERQLAMSIKRLSERLGTKAPALA